MSDETMSDEEWEEDGRRVDFVEQFALIRELAGNPRMEGRVLGYLMVSNKPYVSSAELARALSASAGSISSTTRRLIDLGFIARHAVPGDRSHYFKVDDDIWGSFLSGENRYMRKQHDLFAGMLDELPDGMSGPRKRLRNSRNYFEWLAMHRDKMLAEWQEYRDRLEAEEVGE